MHAKEAWRIALILHKAVDVVFPAFLGWHPCIDDTISVKLDMISLVRLRMYGFDTHFVFAKSITNLGWVCLTLKLARNQPFDPKELLISNIVLL